jgi:hypothetical protein
MLVGVKGYLDDLVIAISRAMKQHCSGNNFLQGD